MTGSRPLMLADVLAELPRQNLSPTVRRDMASAIRKVGVILGRDLAEIPADPARLNAKLQNILPAAHGISQQRWANVRSLVLKAIGLVRPVMPGRRVNPMLPAWKLLQDQMATQASRFRLGPLFRFLSEAEIGPATVTEADLLGYNKRLFAESLRSNPEETWDALLWEWNKAVREIEGFPQVELTRESRKERKTLDEDAFPASLWADRDAWLEQLKGSTLFGEGPAFSVSESTQKTRSYQIQYFASALVRAGLQPSDISSLSVLVDPKNFEKGMRLLFDERGRERKSYLSDIGGGLIAIARHWVLPKSDLPESERETILKRMREIVKRVGPERDGLTEKNHDRLMQFESEEAIGRFLNLPDELRAEIARGKLPENQKHAMADVALALEILFVAPIRINNLAGIRLDKNLIRQRDGFMLVFKENEVKNKERLSFKLPKETCDVIEWYLKVIRPERVRGETDALFIGEDGIRLKAKSTLATQISKKVKERTGLSFNVHLIRHVTSYLFLNQVPGAHHVLRLVLGHKTVETLARAYTGAESKSAHALFDGVIRDLRTRHAPVSKRGRPPKPIEQNLETYRSMPLPDHGRLKKRGR